jgi:hypothetical protein
MKIDTRQSVTTGLKISVKLCESNSKPKNKKQHNDHKLNRQQEEPFSGQIFAFELQ